MKTVSTPGRDPRMILAARALEKEGTFLAAEGEAASLILCPPGWKDDKLLPLVSTLSPGTRLVAGAVSPALSEACDTRGVRLLPLLTDPDYRAANALATGEGTLAEALRLWPKTLGGERILVLGYGACGKEIARLFRGVGCRVFVWSHAGSLARANRDGFPTARPGDLESLSITVNTVPAPDFMPVLSPRLVPGSLFLQVASGPVPDEEALLARGIRCAALPGLPGRYAPESEAAAVLAFLNKSLR